MQDGFYVSVDGDGMLVKMIIEAQSIRRFPPEDIVCSLIEYREYDFSPLWQLITALKASEIFVGGIDVRYSDFEACKNGCELIAEEFEKPVDAYFVQKELERINQIADDGSASYWLYQAQRMVNALTIPISAHTFLCRSFEALYVPDNNSMKHKVDRLFMAYPACKEHVFLETIQLEAAEDVSPTLRKWYIIRTQDELFFFCLLELLRREARICRCECCGQYFVPRTKKKTLYCDRVIIDGKTCKELAPRLKQRQMKTQDAALREYERLYKMYYARAERYEDRTDLSRKRTANDLTFDEFYLWADRARQDSRRYLTGEITADEFLGKITAPI